MGKIPWRRAWQFTPVFLPGEEPDRLQSIRSQRVRHDCVNKQQQQCNLSYKKISGAWEGSGGDQTWRKREKIQGHEQTFAFYSLVLGDNFMCEYVYQTLNFTL